MGAPQHGGVFLSYRREETSHLAGRLADRLMDRFGADRVFMDVDSLEPGLDFPEAIRRAVDRSDVVLALIGNRWATATDATGRKRLHDPDDFVALEISTGLAHPTTRVIPVLVDGARMPDAGELPESLAGLTRRHAVRLDHETFQSDATALMQRLQTLVDVPDKDDEKDSAKPRPWRPADLLSRRNAKLWVAAGIALVVAAVTVGVVLDQREEETQACGAVSDDFTGESIDPAWQVHNDGKVEVTSGSLEITAEDGADVRADLQGEITAPWVSREVTGDFSVETAVDVLPRFTYQGAGLLLYRDGGNYVRLERGFGDTDAIVFEYAADGRHLKVHGPFTGENVLPTTATSVELILERRGTSVTAGWRPTGSPTWQEVGGGASLDGDAQVGLVVLNRSQPPHPDPERQDLTATFDGVRITCHEGQ